jgi:ferredoxin
MSDKFEAAIAKLGSVGLNLFASEKISSLSKEIQNYLIQNSIDFDQNDSIILIANGGRELWKHLAHPLDEDKDPIDNFAIEAMKDFGLRAFGGDFKILFPLTTYLLPLQKLGRELNMSRPSPLGLDINNEYGVWFAFRGVMITKQSIPTIKPNVFDSPCLSCTSLECIKACPVSAVHLEIPFDLKSCGEYRFSQNSQCADRCLSRLSCPYKVEHRYELVQTQFHMGRSRHLKSFKHHVNTTTYKTK